MTSERRAVFHAGAVSMRGAGILLPGPKRCGKSVLTLGLLLNGCGFLAEDVAVLDHQSLQLVPSGDRIAVRRESLSLFPELVGRWTEIPEDPEADPFPQVAFTTPATLGAVFSHPCPVNMIVFPAYDAGVLSPHLEQLSQGEAVLRLLEHCIDLGTNVESGLDFVIRLVKNVRVYTMRYSDTREAVDQVLEEAYAVGRNSFTQVVGCGSLPASAKERYETI